MQIRLFLALLLATNGVHADVLVVDDDIGPGVDFTELQAAVDAAAEGDVLLLRAGDYGAASIVAKSLTLVGDASAEVLLTGPIGIHQLAADQRVLLRGLRIGPPPDLGGIEGTPAIDLVSNLGPVWVEDVTAVGLNSSLFGGIPMGKAIEAVDCAGVTLVRNTIDPASSLQAGGLGAEGSFLQVWDSTVIGTPAELVSSGGNGVELLGAEALFSGGLVQGASGASDPDGPPCTAANGSPGIAVNVTGPFTTIRLQHAEIHGGAGGTGSGGCEDGQPGVPIFPAIDVGVLRVITLAPRPRRLMASSPVREGEALELTYAGKEGDSIFLVSGLHPGPGLFLPAFSSSLVLSPPFGVFSVGSLAATGPLVTSATIGELGAGVDAAVLFLQAVFLDTEGDPVLSSPTSLVLLDVAF